jgi:Phage integrase family
MCDFYQRLAPPSTALAGCAAEALATTFVIARAHARPGGQMLGTREARHVETNFGQQDLRRTGGTAVLQRVTALTDDIGATSYPPAQRPQGRSATGLGTAPWASLVIGKPHRPEGRDDVLVHCWEAEDARRFIAAAKEMGSQAAAFFMLALDTDARKGELCGLKWSDVDLDAGQVSIVRQLIKPRPTPLFGPPKNGATRTIPIAPETVALLRKHKAHQAKLKLANRTHYHNHGLVLAKEWEHPSTA